jgi:hypothetical protein
MDHESLKIKATSAFETSGTTYPATQRHILEDPNARFCILFTSGLFNDAATCQTTNVEGQEV